MRSMFLNICVLKSWNTYIDLKGPEENIICTMDNVRGDFLGHHTAKISNAQKMLKTHTCKH